MVERMAQTPPRGAGGPSSAAQPVLRTDYGAENGPRIEHSDPIEAAKAALWRHRAYFSTPPDHVLRDLVNAILAAADTVMEVRYTAVRQAWGREGLREHVRAEMRLNLLDQVTRTGRIPTALPVETLRYFLFPSYFPPAEDGGVAGTGEVPAEYVNDAEWQIVELRLWVPVRTPPVDRAAAVRAGIL